MFTVGAVALNPGEATPARPSGNTRATGPAPGSIEALQARVTRLPKDPGGWAALGMAYVQQGRTTADPATYARAEKALRTSLTVQGKDNADAEIATGALAAARHDFPAALDWALRATTSDPYSASAQGVLADAYTQLGRYAEADAAVQKMTDLRPDAASLARASYAFELKGDTAEARDLMRRSLTAAATPGESAFAHAVLASLALQDGDTRGALTEAQTGLRAAPGDSALLEARARVHEALGDTAQAVADYQAAIAIAPLPHYLLGLGELEQSLGHRGQAEAQYAVLRAQDRIRETTGTTADTDAILFEGDHGSPERAVTLAEEALRARPFVAVHDAYAWALHRAGRDTEALAQADQALSLGTRSALYHYHRAAIQHALGHPDAARRDLNQALRQPGFHPLHADAARALLQRIDTTP
ncbi:tetratricopeptide repeat protein [Streptomyces sp. G-G2]|uniref:tetratricopeptide repeat protein n=1 Tax=Streptomyces sp. G-G2 TaxID=3046201 RepID=UPI0024BAC344|nr:tetratricopeptide repeat protein [Streptomyces sp. G-G2]MDJ0384514.1 tetratricopeptide repeat protein [Streptomyces sp. G-G2]